MAQDRPCSRGRSSRLADLAVKSYVGLLEVWPFIGHDSLSPENPLPASCIQVDLRHLDCQALLPSPHLPIKFTVMTFLTGSL
jgi:hypothetical protein